MAGDWKLTKIQISMDGAEPDYIARKRYYTARDQYHTVLEAVSCGVPVIVSDHVGAKDIIGGGGIVVKAGSCEELKDASCAARLRDWKR